MKDSRRPPESDDSHTWSKSTWQEWINEEVNEREEGFARIPHELVAAASRENKHAREYHGREILELLQNADDANALGGRACRVRLELREEGLLVANTGTPFRKGGLLSLMTSDHSPKEHDTRARHIGNKGLGFRALLNWSAQPMISSGELEVEFNQDRAQAWLRAACAKHPRLRDVIEDLPEGASPIATLAIPFEVNRDAPLKRRAAELREAGYDTVIAIPTSESDIHAQIEAQASEFPSECLLFTNHIVEFAIQTPSLDRVWRVTREGATVTLTRTDGTDETSETWHLIQQRGELPVELARGAQHHDFHLCLAVPSDRSPKPGFLYNYFPTQVRFPFPVVAHATVEITSNRQNLIESKTNEHILGELAHLLAKFAESMVTEQDPWRALRIIAPSGSLDPLLEKLEFLKALREQARQMPIAPLWWGGFGAPRSLSRLEKELQPYLPTGSFPDVVAWTTDYHLNETFTKLGTPVLSTRDLVERLDAIGRAALDTRDRARLIRGLLETRIAQGTLPSSLLIDNDGVPIEDSSAAFLPSSAAASVELPEWMSVKTIHPDLVLALREALQATSPRELVYDLIAFEVREFALVPFASAINAQANERSRTTPDQEPAFRDAALRTIMQLYLASEERSTSTPANLNLVLPKRKGGFAPASTLYAGQEYPMGALMEALLVGVPTDRFVADLRPIAPAATENDVEAFLSWTGVATLPRTQQISTGMDHPFTKYARSRVTLPAAFSQNLVVAKREDLDPSTIDKLTTLDALDDILTNADAHAILAWVASDPRIEKWRIENDASAEFDLHLYRKQYVRTLEGQPVPSFVLWRLSTHDWLPTLNGECRAPQACTLARSLPEDLHALLPVPKIDETSPILKFKQVDRKRIRGALQQVGVNVGLEEWSADELYAFLELLPTRDPEGRSARSLYRQLVQRLEGDIREDDPNRAPFIEGGMVWARRGEKASYHPVSDAYYIDSATLPAVVTRAFPLLDLEPRRGARKVYNLFGVKSLDSRAVEISITAVDLDRRSTDLARELHSAKIIALAHRLDADRDPQGVARLHALKVHLCSKVQGIARINELEIPIEMRSDDPPLLVGDDAYVVVDESPPESRLLGNELLSDAVATVIANVFRIENASEFARLASCAPSRREPLLQRLLGSHALDLVRQATERLHSPQDNDEEDETPAWYEPHPQPGEANQDNDQDDEETADEEDEDGGDDDGPRGPVQRIDVEPTEYDPKPPSKTIRRRVRATPTSRPPRPGSRVVDAARCEDLGFRFEEECGRFPLKVHHQQGEEAFGCDLISFASAEARAEFEKTTDRSLIARFIEVKGKRSTDGTFTLMGNELDAARRHRDAYFVYVIFEPKEGGEYDLYAIADPTAVKSRDVHIVDVLRVTESSVQKWAVTEVQEDN